MKQLLSYSSVATYLACTILLLMLTLCGCASVVPGQPPVFVTETVRVSTNYELHGDIAKAVESLKIATTIDPENSHLREELARLIAKRDQQAEQHFNAGSALKTSKPVEARREFLQALRIRADYTEALTALRSLQFTSAKELIQKRLKKEAREAALRSESQDRNADEDISTGDYSLDIAISALEEGDFTTAIREFEKIKELYPNDPDIKEYLNKAWYNLGKASLIKMEYKKALAAFVKVRKGYENVDDYIAKCKKSLKKQGSRY